MTYDYNCWRMCINEYFRLLAAGGDEITRDAVLHEIAGIFDKDGPQRSTIQRWVNDFEDHGVVGPLRNRTEKYWSRVESLHLELARQLFHQQPTAFYDEICFGIFVVYGVQYSKEQLCEALKKDGFTRKVL